MMGGGRLDELTARQYIYVVPGCYTVTDRDDHAWPDIICPKAEGTSFRIMIGSSGWDELFRQYDQAKNNQSLIPSLRTTLIGMKSIVFGSHAKLIVLFAIT